MEEVKKVAEAAEVSEAKKAAAAAEETKKKFDIRTVINWGSLLRVVLCLGVAGVLTYFTVFLEFSWMASARTARTYANMLKFYLVQNDGQYKQLYYSLLVVGMVVWTVLALAISELIIRAVRNAVKKSRAKKAAKASKA